MDDGCERRHAAINKWMQSWIVWLLDLILSVMSFFIYPRMLDNVRRNVLQAIIEYDLSRGNESINGESDSIDNMEEVD